MAEQSSPSFERFFHGSAKKFEVIEARQARPARQGVITPDGESLKAIYVTPDPRFALAFAALPEGDATIDPYSQTVIFEHPQLFDPSRDVYVYEIDSRAIPHEKMRNIDPLQYAIVDVPSVVPVHIHTIKAGILFRHYRMLNWKPNLGRKRDLLLNFSDKVHIAYQTIIQHVPI